nr:glycosyltransferase [Antarcticibacterium flavum]
MNIANALLPFVDKSFLCCTRQEGLLKKEIKNEVGYLFLSKKSSLDPLAILKLKKFIRENKIELVHAHSTSFFLPGILKLSGSKFKLIWHDHYGESENLEKREYRILKRFSKLFSGIISVNTVLRNWAIQKLDCNKVIEIKNFIPELELTEESKIKLRGNQDDFKIICVANLRPQKDHLTLLRAFEMLKPDINVSLHLIGEDPGTMYSASILKAIENSSVKHKIFFYGTQVGIIPFLKKADLGILSSRSEGLPLALLEYGMAGLPVICTRVGKCPEVIGEYGETVPKENSKALIEKINFYINHPDKMNIDSTQFQQRIKEKYSELIIINRILDFY